LRDEHWELVLNNTEEFMNTTFALDPYGKVWVLRWSYSFTETPSYTLGYFEEETQVWKWQDVPSLYTEDIFVGDIAVDNNGRVWVSGNNSGGNFVQVLSWSENSLNLVENYNEENSNTDDFYELSFTKSGQIWTMNNGVFWMDTTTELPKPLPNWALEAEKLLGQYGGWVILIFAILIYGSFLWEMKIKPKE
jgi:streptogramin lyase